MRHTQRVARSSYSWRELAARSCAGAIQMRNFNLSRLGPDRLEFPGVSSTLGHPKNGAAILEAKRTRAQARRNMCHETACRGDIDTSVLLVNGRYRMCIDVR